MQRLRMPVYTEILMKKQKANSTTDNNRMACMYQLRLACGFLHFRGFAGCCWRGLELRQWVRPSKDVLANKDRSYDHENGENNQTKVPILPILVTTNQGRDGQTNHAHKFDENVECRARRILEWIADRVANNASFSLVGLLDLQLLAKFFAVVPSSSSIAHENRKHTSAHQGPCKDTHEAPH